MVLHCKHEVSNLHPLHFSAGSGFVVAVFCDSSSGIIFACNMVIALCQYAHDNTIVNIYTYHDGSVIPVHCSTLFPSLKLRHDWLVLLGHGTSIDFLPTLKVKVPVKA